MTESKLYGTLCHISDYYNDKNNGYEYGVNIYDNEDLDTPLECIWFKSELKRQEFIDQDELIIVEDA
jgi:hypothetical protein